MNKVFDKIKPWVYLDDQGKADAVRLAAQVGLDQIDYRQYRLCKTGSKNPSRYYGDTFENPPGYPSLVSNGEFVWLYFDERDGWFKTSPVLRCEPKGEGFLVETENSYYELKAV